MFVQRPVDIVISTIDIYYNLQVPWIKVSPILTKEDEEKVINLLGLPEALDEREFEIVNSVNDIIKIVEQHATIENRISLSQQLIHFFKGSHNVGQVKSGNCNLEDILPLDSILVNQQPPKNINDLIHLGTKPLQKRNLIGLEYEEKLSKMLANPKNHFMITEGVIFPHASSETGVWGTGMSFVTFSEPVKLGELAKPITTMITLAAVDSEKHVDTLAIIIDALNDQSFMEMLNKFHTNKQIFEWFQRKEGSLYEKNFSSVY